MTYGSSARHKYHAYLDKKKHRMTREKQKKRNEVGVNLGRSGKEELKAKELPLEANIVSLHAPFVQKAIKADLKGLIVLVTESNALRRRAEEKMTVVVYLSKIQDANVC
ncbi:hypothetical protein ACJMK2_006532 [Sinanodonta woodiana]|uniref:Uncharacterized protein n=1 Tax=Sinanodonta woodiana TaxID=1069815 RepID=A0ABD3VU65_SINWO